MTKYLFGCKSMSFLGLVELDDEVELEDGEPEDDGEDEDGRHDQEEDDLEPDVVEHDHHVQQQPEGEEDVGEVGCEPGHQEQVVEGDGAPGGQEVGGDQEDVDEDGQQQEGLRIAGRVTISSNPGVRVMARLADMRGGEWRTVRISYHLISFWYCLLSQKSFLSNNTQM